MDIETYLIAAQSENKHWWFRGRRKILKAVLDCFFLATGQPRNILEVGCGSGGNLSLLSNYGKVFAVEIDDNAITRSTCRGIAQIEKGWLPDGLPFDNTVFDLVAAFDVIEHVEDDHKSVRTMQARIKPNGLLILTVPAYNALWRSLDTISHHKRRYTRTRLISLLKDSGFNVLFSSYFNTLLLPPAIAYIIIDKLFKGNPYRGLRKPPAQINSLLNMIFTMESFIIPKIALPFGLSIIVCARTISEKNKEKVK